jgi:hypothetical protein
MEAIRRSLRFLGDCLRQMTKERLKGGKNRLAIKLLV